MTTMINTIKSIRIMEFIKDPVKVFFISTMIVNGGNYLYNLVLGNTLKPADFSEAGLLITLLLIFSFLAMTFQVTATKFSIEYDRAAKESFKKWIYQVAFFSSIGLLLILVIFHTAISRYFHLSSSWSILLFACMLPAYFFMSVKRGFVQGSEKFYELAGSYQLEMWVRFAVTILFIWLLRAPLGNLIAIAIFISIMAAQLPLGPFVGVSLRGARFDGQKQVLKFFLLTAAYECAQILINYSDTLLVKHYFESHTAGLYISMSLVGRMIYFVTWMVVMVLIPKVIRLKKEGKPFTKPLLEYFFVISLISTVIIFLAYWFDEQLVRVLFGSSYVEVAQYLWLYGTATAFFALANIFIYYFLSLDEYVPVYIAIVSGLIQVLLLFIFHKTLDQIIYVQVTNMGVLLIVQAVFFIKKTTMKNT